MSTNKELFVKDYFISKDKEEILKLNSEVNENTNSELTISEKLDKKREEIQLNDLRIKELEDKLVKIIIEYRKFYYYFKRTRQRYYYSELIKIVKNYRETRKEILDLKNKRSELNLEIIELKKEWNKLEKRNKELFLKISSKKSFFLI